MKKMKNEALKYKKAGYDVIPIGQNKNSLVVWKELQTTGVTESQINEWWDKWPDANIGILTGMINRLAVIDVDEPIGYEEIERLIPDSLIMPTSKTPKGGNHYYFSIDKDIPGNVRTIPGCDLRATGNYIIAPPSINGNGKKYEWENGLSLLEMHPPGMPVAYINKLNNSIYKENVIECDKLLHELQQVTISLDKGKRNDSLFHIANSLFKGGMTKDNVAYTVRNIAKNSNPPLTEKEITTILDSAFKRILGRNRNIHQEVSLWVSVTSGDFHVTSCYSELQVVTKDEKAAVRRALVRLVSDGILEKSGKRDGIYRLKETICEDIDFMNADTTPFDVRWPMDVHELVEIYRKSIIIIAGESNAGKTAYCLNVAKRNRKRHDILYLLSEGDAAELRIRLEKFNEPLESWKDVRFRNIRGGNLSKLIDPNGFNIIDYLELHKDFFEVSGIINEIYERLDGGIAVIAIQKPEGRDLGIGGRGTLDKARLYLSIEPNKIKIVKGKIWRSEFVNPNGMFTTWKLGGGCNFKRDSNQWLR